MLLQGSTFVPIKSMSKIIKEFQHLILFVLRTKPELLRQQLQQAKDIECSVFESFCHSMNEEEMQKETTKRIIGTNILFGMMINILTENPKGLKSNALQLYLIGRGLKSVSSRSYLGFCAANEISKNCNNLLRLMRHMVCGHICRTARRDHNFDHDKMGKEIDKQYNPSTIHKAIDPITGEVK
eukprot:scaffold6318_cov228-Skeletonema_dohrnii-CCMP3373.AAC.1